MRLSLRIFWLIAIEGIGQQDELSLYIIINRITGAMSCAVLFITTFRQAVINKKPFEPFCKE